MMKNKVLKDYLGSYTGVNDTIANISKDQDFPFVDSSVVGIKFDEVKNQYCKAFGIEDIMSNDAVIVLNGQDYFVEFKNTENPAKKVLNGKIRDSLLIYLDILDETLSYARKSLGYILVYKKNMKYCHLEAGLKSLANTRNESIERDVCKVRRNSKGIYFKDVLFMGPEEFKKCIESVH